jgi:hypothetical protein
VTVIDPAHPLCGRTFPVVSVSRQPRDIGYVVVAYRDAIRLRLPVPATDLSSPTTRTPPTKWTPAAVREFLALVAEVSPPCPNRRRSGRGSRPR